MLPNLLVKKKFDSFYTIPYQNDGRILAISDIHGCIKTLRKLLENVQLQKNDYLFLLGDYINRGPDSLAVLAYIIKLIEDGYRVFPVRGNHEQMLLEELIPQKGLDLEGIQLLNKDTQAKFLQLLQMLPYYYSIDNFLMVHAGFNLDIDEPLTDYDEMLWVRNFDNEDSIIKQQVIHGHDSTFLQNIERAIDDNQPSINLDNACYSGRWFMGNLLCYDVLKKKLYKQKCLDTI